MKVEQLIAAKEKLGFDVFTSNAKPYNLNLDYVRNSDRLSNQFNDKLYVYWFDVAWTLRTFNMTTDPGLKPRLNPSNPLGVAIVDFPQQVKGGFKLGLHQGKYKALVQAKPFRVIRDFNKDKLLDFIKPDLSDCDFHVYRGKDGSEVIDYKLNGKLIWRENTGMFGINCHRANDNGQSVNVDGWSEGCQVLQNNIILHPENQEKVYSYDYFMHLCEMSADNWGNSFTPTFLRDVDVV